MPPIALGSKHQDLLKAYLEVSKSEKPDWTSIALQADFASAKYARDQFAIIKKKLLATPDGEPTNFSDTHLTLLQTVMRVLKAETDWEKVAQLAKFKTPKYARDRWAIVKNKLSGASISSATTPINNKSTPTRKRKKIEADDDDDEQDLTPADEDETLAKRSKAVKGKKTNKKETPKKVKIEVQESEADVEADFDAEGHDNDQARETYSLQAQVDEQIKAEMQEDMDDQAFEADMFRLD